MDFKLLTTSEHQLLGELGPQQGINTLLAEALKIIETRSNPRRTLHALEVTAVLLKSLFRKRFSNFGHDFFVATGLLPDDTATTPAPKSAIGADAYFATLLSSINSILLSETDAVPHKSIALSILLAIATAQDNIADNYLLEYLHASDVLTTLADLFAFAAFHPDEFRGLSADAAVLLVILTAHHKFEQPNPPAKAVVASWSARDNLRAGSASLGLLIHLSASVGHTQGSHPPSPSGGAVAAVTNTVASIVSWIPIVGAIVAGPIQAAPPTAPLQPRLSISSRSSTSSNTSTSSETVLSGPSVPSSEDPMAIAALMAVYELAATNPLFLVAACYPEGTPPPPNAPFHPHPTPPLFAGVLTAASSSFQSTKNPVSEGRAHLCLMILDALTRRGVSLQAIYDPAIHAPPLLTLPCTTPSLTTSAMSLVPSPPLINHIYTALTHLLAFNIRKPIPVPLYRKAFDILRKLAIHEFHTSSSAPIKWPTLWNALIRFIRFTSQEALINDTSVAAISAEALRLLNYYTVFGLAIFPDQSLHDVLVTDVMRIAPLLKKLNIAAKASPEEDPRLPQLAVLLHLINFYTPFFTEVAAEGHPLEPKKPTDDPEAQQEEEDETVTSETIATHLFSPEEMSEVIRRRWEELGLAQSRYVTAADVSDPTSLISSDGGLSEQELWESSVKSLVYRTKSSLKINGRL